MEVTTLEKQNPVRPKKSVCETETTQVDFFKKSAS
jgi:hypothetical protein